MRGTDQPLVSVVMPAYNHERFIRQSIESVLAQTHRPLELVVIDDGSSDATPSIVAGLEEEARSQLDRFVFLRQKNQGIPRTLNTALEHARGEFIATIGSDDVYLPDKIERLLAVPDWAEPSVVVVFGDAYIIDETGTRVGLLEDQSTADPEAPGAETLFLAHCLRFQDSPQPGPLGSYASMLRGAYIPAVSTLMRSSALSEVGGYDEQLFVEDYGMWLLLGRDHRILAVPDVVAEKRFHGNNASVVETRRIFRDVLELMVRERSSCRSDPVADAERRSSRDRAYLALRSHGTASDLLRVAARHPVSAPRELLEARRNAS